MDVQTSTSWKKYIFWFAQEHVDFRRAEIESITKLFGIQWRITDDSNKLVHRPFWIVELHGEDAARAIASRSISLRCILEFWSHSETIPKLHKDLKNFIIENDLNLKDLFRPDESFKIVVETYNKHFSQKEKIEKIESFSYLPFGENVNLRSPVNEWWYIEFYGFDTKNIPTQPVDVLFGKLIADGQRNLINELSLKKRKFIGNTSMDAQLSILMANQGLIKNGDLVFDPFVGTGSLLVSAAKFGGYVFGIDIDYMILHAKSRPSRITQKVRETDESVRANLEQYNCADKYLDVLISDFSNPIWRDGLEFDCIITDPPYGIREASEKVKKKSNKDKRTEGLLHYPSTSAYNLQNLYADLLNFAAKHLKLNGRLVCWLPVYKEDYDEQCLPKHSNLRLIANSVQELSAWTCRRLLTYEKLPEMVDEQPIESNFLLTDFRPRYFAIGQGIREAKRIERAELREIGRLEALKRGKKIKD